MSNSEQDFSKTGFAKSYVLPALFIFLLPAISLAFFLHAQARFDNDARESILNMIESDETLSEQEREELITLYERVPFSRLLLNKEFAAQVDGTTRFHFAFFRWMIRISALSIVSGIGVFLLAGVCVVLSLQSQYAQYISLSVGWHVLRLYSAIQTIIQATLAVALSYWVTALWFNIYVPKLIIIVAVLAVGAVGVVLAGIFKKPNLDFAIEGKVIERESDTWLWNELHRICTAANTDPPDQVILGIDDNFFVTEHAVTVDEKIYRGRTLFVSLSLLKQLNGAEADAVLAHEMAHFSGKDTLYSKKISPLLDRYGHYLQALHEGGVTLPVFYFMVCFRGLFELSLGRLSRQREFRADRIASEITSPSDVAGALLRIAAYSTYRATVEQELFDQERAMESANVAERIELGFAEFARSFTSKQDIGELVTTHPFDSHPPLDQRMQAVGVEFHSALPQSLLSVTGDGRWYHAIRNAEQLEKEQWDEFEQRFRDYHEATLPYRFIPSNDYEREIVARSFPEVTFEGKEGTVVFDYEKIRHATWAAPVRYADISSMSIDDSSILQIYHTGAGVKTIKTKKFGKDQQAVIDTLNHYYGRYATAAAYLEQKNSD